MSAFFMDITKNTLEHTRLLIVQNLKLYPEVSGQILKKFSYF